MVVTVRCYDSETLLYNRGLSAVTIRDPDGVPQFQRIGLEAWIVARYVAGLVCRQRVQKACGKSVLCFY